MPPDEPTDEEKLEEEPEDYNTPFSLPDDGFTGTEDNSGREYHHPRLDATHPVTDTNIQQEELYDEGVSGAAEASEPNARDEVIGYSKPGREDRTTKKPGRKSGPDKKAA